MFKVTIYKINRFLQVVNGCSGPVHLVYPDGKKENINKQYRLQSRLKQQYADNNKCIRLLLQVPEGKDYMKVINYAIGDC